MQHKQQNEALLRTFAPSAGPTGGDGFALPATSSSLILPVTCNYTKVALKEVLQHHSWPSAIPVLLCHWLAFAAMVTTRLCGAIFCCLNPRLRVGNRTPISC
jgi:hypothetical protein